MKPLRISIVTPSYNQGPFLEQAILSVLSQGYPDLEYSVIDGGSTDNSLEIIRRYGDRLHSWVSEKDRGQYHAINKGFSRSTGEIMAWLNSDDMFFPWTFAFVGQVFEQHPDVEWLTTSCPITLDRDGLLRARLISSGFSRESFSEGRHLGRNPVHMYWIQQESTFWRRSLWERAGGRVDDSLQMAGDLELWSRFYRHAELYALNHPLGGFRVHGNQKTANMDHYYREADPIMAQWRYDKLKFLARKVIFKLKLHKQRPLKKFIDDRFGYDFRVIHGRYDGRSLGWAKMMYRKFV